MTDIVGFPDDVEDDEAELDDDLDEEHPWSGGYPGSGISMGGGGSKGSGGPGGQITPSPPSNDDDDHDPDNSYGERVNAIGAYSPTTRREGAEQCLACGDTYPAETDYLGYYCEDCRPPGSFTEEQC